jgi:hypothetical protein
MHRSLSSQLKIDSSYEIYTHMYIYIWTHILEKIESCEIEWHCHFLNQKGQYSYSGFPVTWAFVWFK